MAAGQNSKRTFEDIRKAILECLSSGQHTINQISSKTRINWKTVKLHLDHLVSRGLVNNVLNCDYVKIFEISDEGLVRNSIQSTSKIN